MSRLRRGKLPFSGLTSGGTSLITAPCASMISDTRRRWARGPGSAWPPAMMATVWPPASIVAAWAAPSMPNARPETTVAPSSTERRASRAARLRPTAVGRRVPTMATDRRGMQRRSRAPAIEHRRRHRQDVEAWRIAGIERGHGPHAVRTEHRPGLLGPVEPPPRCRRRRCSADGGPRHRRAGAVEGVPSRAADQDGGGRAEDSRQAREGMLADARHGRQREPCVALEVEGLAHAARARSCGSRRPAAAWMVAGSTVDASPRSAMVRAMRSTRWTPARRPGARLRDVGKRPTRGRSERGRLGHVGPRELGVQPAAIPCSSGRASGGDARRDHGGGLRRLHRDELTGRHATQLDPEVESIEERAADPSHVAIGLPCRAGARSQPVPLEATSAGVHRRDDLDAGRVADMTRSTSDDDLAFLQVAAAVRRARRGRTRPARPGRGCLGARG